MATGIGLVVKIAAETRQAVADIHDVNRALDGTGTSTNTAGRMFSSLKSVALPVIGAIASAVGTAAIAMIEFGKAAWEDHQEAERLARTLATIPGITQDMIDANEAWITSTMFATHVTDTDLREAISGLVLITNDLGAAQQYATAAADLATVANVEYGTAVDAVHQALIGKSRALMTLAPQLDTNKDGTLSLAEAQAILTDETLKGAAASAAADDPWGTLMLLWQEIQESLAQFMIPVLEKLGAWFQDPANQAKLTEYINKLGQMSYELGEKLLPKLDEWLAWLQSPEGKASIQKWTDFASDLAAAVADIAQAIGWIGEQYNKLPGPLKTLLGKVGVGFRIGEILPGGSTQSASVGTFATQSTGITVNFYGGIHSDPEATARAITGSLRASQARNARAVPLTQQLEPAW